MSRLATSFVLGYHGCDQSIAAAALTGNNELKPSANDFDWLGHGTYFWEADPQRALEYAEWKKGRGEIKNPAIVGAVIDLRNCLDLTNRDDLELTAYAFAEYEKEKKIANLSMATNENAAGDKFDGLVLRYLDCAVINYLHHMIDEYIEDENNTTKDVERFDTVRGMFAEGGQLYEGAGFSAKTHTQIAVRNSQCIIGYFKPRI